MKPVEKDRRVRRTRQLLQDALIALMLEKPYHAISVQDILDRADVGRSTFYAHYRDKDDLLLGGFDRLLEALGRHMDAGEGHGAGQPFFPALELFRHVQENHWLYKALVWGQGVDLLFKHGQKALSERIEHHLGSQITDLEALSIPLPVLSSYLAGSLITLLQWWLDNRMPYSPERMAEIYQQLVLPGVHAAMQISADRL